MTNFQADVFQNEFLPEGADVVDAVVTVTSAGGQGASGATVTSRERVEVIVIDCSGSMNEDGGSKIRAARQATMTAIDTLTDGTLFAVVAGVDGAYALYPPNSGVERVNPQTREQAKQIVSQVRAKGGTAIGSWLLAAGGLFNLVPDSINHCILLTDGKNQSESDRVLNGAIQACVGLFQCDARGLGTDWNIDELRRISSALLGTVDIIPHPDQMEAEFRALTEQAMGKEVGSVALRLWTPQGSQLEFVKEVAPNIEDLTAKATAVNPLTDDYPLGAWAGDESRDYHIRVRIPVGAVGDERLAARVMLMVDGVEQPSALVRAVWTNDDALSTRINREVAHYTGQAELAEAIADGLAARDAGDSESATLKLGRAVQLAHEAGNGDTVRLLEKVVDVDDAESGTVRLKREVEQADAMALDVRSTRTVRVNKK